MERTFGAHLKELIRSAGLTQQSFYEQLGITKAYFYDIVSGRVNPMPARLQFRTVEILKLDESESNTFFDLAAREREEIPVDIAKSIKSNHQTADLLRAWLKQLSINV